MNDIVPDLLEKIERDFSLSLRRNKKIKSIQKMIEEGTATYKQANEYANEVGSILSEALTTHINSEVLPEGKMHYNIADRVLNKTLKNNHDLVAKISADIQERLNKSIGLGLKGVRPSLSQRRIDSIINRIVAEEVFDNVEWILKEPIINFTLSVVDDTVKENVDFQGESGLYPKLIRTAHGNDPCEWCKSLVGAYKYPHIPDDIYKRHDRCRCTVDYDPGDSRRENIWGRSS